MLRPLLPLLLLLLACAAPSLPQETSLTDAEKAECTAKGGVVGRVGKSRTEVCHERTTDGGKSCTTLSQCESYMCETDLSKLSSEQYRGTAPVTGQCAAWTGYWDGCHDIVIDGRYRGRCAH